MPRRSRVNCPSGKYGARVWAVCTAKAVLPRPGCPQSTATGGRAGSRSSASARSRSSAGPRAVKSLRSRGRASAWCAVRSVAGADSGSVPGSSASPVVTGRERPRLAPSSSRRAPAASRRRDAARACAVRRCGPRDRPRSMHESPHAHSRGMRKFLLREPALLHKPRNSAPKSPVAGEPVPMLKSPTTPGSTGPATPPAKVCGILLLRVEVPVLPGELRVG